MGIFKTEQVLSILNINSYFKTSIPTIGNDNFSIISIRKVAVV
jgi:hypothetical protein